MLTEQEPDNAGGFNLYGAIATSSLDNFGLAFKVGL